MIATIDLGGTRTKYGLVEEGRIISSASCPADAQGSLEAHLNLVIQSLREQSAGVGTDLESCRGLGILCSGLVDNRAMRVLSTNGKYDDARDFDFPAWAEKEACLELRMENDARGALMAEWRFGAGQGVDNLLMLSFGTGIGSSVVIDGKLLTGPHFSGGILGGHILVNSGGRKCTCGAVGCLESEASGWVLPELVRTHALYSESSLREAEQIGFKELLGHADAGDACAAAVRAHCFRYWGEALVSLIHTYDPERVIIGGGLMNSSDGVLEHFRESLAQHLWGDPAQVEIVAASHPDGAGLIGAASLFSH